MSGLIIPLVIVLFVGIVLVFMYNSLISKKNNVENAFSSIDVMLKKRYDLIPNLVETVKQYMEHERGTLTEITQLRAKALSGDTSMEEKVEIENQIASKMRGIMVAVENYPQLRANENFMHLQATWNEIEEQISASRRAYNASVLDLNNAVEMFPTNIMAGMMSLQKRTFFEIPAEERKNVSAKELFNN